MIGVKINGRLGNQLFQYAFAFNIAKKINSRFLIIENNLCPLEITKYFILSAFLPSLNRLFLKFVKPNRNFPALIFENGISPSINLHRILNNVVYEGFFHSESYFAEYRHLIKNQFRIKKVYEGIFNVNYGALFESKQIVAVHIRRTDYLQHGNEELGGEDLSLPMDYYEKCLSLIPNLHSYKVIFVSDDIDYVKSYFGMQPNFMFEKNESIIDFQIIKNANIVVLANSSFSWWAGFLNDKATRIFAPKYWLGYKSKFEYPKEPFLPSWELVHHQEE